MSKQLPRIVIPEVVIPASTITDCEQCFYYEASHDGYGDLCKFCNHPNLSRISNQMNEYGFPVIAGTQVWMHCPLPDAQ